MKGLQGPEQKSRQVTRGVTVLSARPNTHKHAPADIAIAPTTPYTYNMRDTKTV